MPETEAARIFVVELAGRVAIVKNGVRQSTPFLDIAFRVSDGMLSIAFPPGYGRKGKTPSTRTRAPPGSWHRPSAVRAWRFWLDDRITRLESLRYSLRSSLGPPTEHARGASS